MPVSEEVILQKRVVYYKDVAETSFNNWQKASALNRKLNCLIVDLFKKLDKGGLLCDEDVEDVLELLDEDAIRELNLIRL